MRSALARPGRGCSNKTQFKEEATPSLARKYAQKLPSFMVWQIRTGQLPAIRSWMFCTIAAYWCQRLEGANTREMAWRESEYQTIFLKPLSHAKDKSWNKARNFACKLLEVPMWPGNLWIQVPSSFLSKPPKPNGPGFPIILPSMFKMIEEPLEGCQVIHLGSLDLILTRNAIDIEEARMDMLYLYLIQINGSPSSANKLEFLVLQSHQSATRKRK